MRGEHPRPDEIAPVMPGSSPHARGASDTKTTIADINGVIPACAGSICEFFLCQSSHRGHPRMRGEHLTCPPPTR